ncbi:peptide MFS transporter [Hymenobacter sp. BT683]|uniref:Peptide MFS transporter n=1 Tax=Hymenobacter jeongseonensis TaxID=2791027 RepID=A0ABS0IMI5_9BACT|nr:peptide MFS transporter [Hymenobacter jeongseonensis]MBF9239565.1 peptide MFS transporter [Hymenobacter jeongseonensis]
MQTIPAQTGQPLSADSTSHPRGLYLLFATEMWERFSYYGMRAVLVLFLTKAMMMDKAFASKFYGGYTSLVYLTPLIGGYISDRYWGNRRSIMTGGLLMALGQFTLFFSASNYGPAETHALSHWLLYLGLGVMIVGNGFFKPNISSMVGSLYSATDKRKDAAYTIFYMGINLGSFLGNTITSLIGDKEGHPEAFRWAFLACGIAMLLSVVVFNWGKDKHLHTPTGEPVGLTPAQSGGVMGIYALLPVLLAIILGILWLDSAMFPTIAPLLGVAVIGIAFMIFSDKSLSGADIKGIMVIFIVSFFVVFFWAAFEQAPASLTFFADEQMDRTIFGYTLPASIFQNLNAIFVVVGAPLMAMVWTALGRRGAEPPSPLKMAIGLGLLAAGYLVMCFGVTNLQPGVKVSMFFLVALYFLHSVGELCLSPIGLSLVNKLAPVKFASLLMAVWFLANAAANYLAGYMSSLYPDPKSTGPAPQILGYQITSLYDFFMVFVVSAAVAAGLLFLISGKLAKMMDARNYPAPTTQA